MAQIAQQGFCTTICVSQVCKKANKRARVSLLKIFEEMKKYIELGENSQFRPPNFSIDKSQQIALVVRSKLKRRKKMMKVMCISFRTTADDLIMSNGKSTKRAIGRSENLRGAQITSDSKKLWQSAVVYYYSGLSQFF